MEPRPCRTQVVVLVRQQPDARRLERVRVISGEACRQRDVVISMPAQKLLAIVVSLEMLARKLADGLQHPVAPSGEAKEAFLDERLQDVEFGVADLLCGLQCAAACEDGERADDPLLFA